MTNFKEIPKHPRYEISISGIIRNRKTKAIKSQYISSTGYYMVSFSYNNKSKPFRVHRLLAVTFLSNPLNLPCINHKNGIKTDNNIDNLEWCNHQDNMTHAFENGLANNKGEHNGQSKLTLDKVMKIKALLKSGMSQNKIANKFNISRSTILGINIGRLWKWV